MQDNYRPQLLPPGFSDLLSPDASWEAALIERFMAVAALAGYERIKPPLMEYEESLLSGPGASMARHTFRLLDPVSHRMMGLRADMTTQIGRIAASRLRNKPRPLRVSYAGEVLRVGQEQLRPARQVFQMGVELIGSAAQMADMEVIMLAVEALHAIKVPALTIDLHSPILLAKLLGADPKDALLKALDRKDVLEARHLGAGELLLSLLNCPHEVQSALDYLDAKTLPGDVKDEVKKIRKLADLLRDADPSLHVTLDPVDRRFFDYHDGICYTFFSSAMLGEIGRGGRYKNDAGESATGFSLYLDRLMRGLPSPGVPHRLYVPVGVPYRIVKALREEQWVVVRGLNAIADIGEAARAEGCSHYWMAGDIIAL